MIRLAEDYGISDVGLAKICKKLDVPRPSRGYWAKSHHGIRVKKLPLPPQKDGTPSETIIRVPTVRFERQKESREIQETEKRETAEDAKIVVEDELAKPHPIVRKTRSTLRQARVDDYGVVQCSGAGVKKVAKELLEILKSEKLALDWRSRQQSRATVRQFIEIELDKLPEVYAPNIYETKCDLAYRHVYDHYFGPGQNVYEAAA